MIVTFLINYLKKLLYDVQCYNYMAIDVVKGDNILCVIVVEFKAHLS